MLEDLREAIVWGAARALCRAWAGEADLSNKQIESELQRLARTWLSRQGAPRNSSDYQSAVAESSSLVTEVRSRANERAETDVNWQQWAFHGR